MVTNDPDLAGSTADWATSGALVDFRRFLALALLVVFSGDDALGVVDAILTLSVLVGAN